MGMTIWVNFFKDGMVSSDESDKSYLYRHVRKLDAICQKIRIRKLSEYFDTTDLQSNCNNSSLQPESSWGLMAKISKWFIPDEEITEITQLIEQLEKHPIRFGILSNQYSHVMQDLDDCRNSILKAKNDGAKFHLCVVM